MPCVHIVTLFLIYFVIASFMPAAVILTYSYQVIERMLAKTLILSECMCKVVISSCIANARQL